MVWVADDNLPPGMSEVAARPLWASTVVFSDEDANNSDKTFDMAADSGTRVRGLLVTGIRVEFTATSTVGVRTFRLEVHDGEGDVIFAQVMDASLNLTALGTRSINMARWLSVLVGPESHEFLPPDLWLKHDWRLRVYDSAAVDPTGDDMVVHIRGQKLWAQK